jgi:hypothetical protein
MNDPLLCVVLLNWHNSDDTLACLQQLQVSDYPHLQVVVVDNGSTDASVERLRLAFPNVPLICSPVNRGFAGGVNQGLQYAAAIGAEYVLLLNSDVHFAPDMLSKLLAIVKHDTQSALYTPRLLRAAPPRSLWYALCEKLARVLNMPGLAPQPLTGEYLWVHGQRLRTDGLEVIGENARDPQRFDNIPVDIIYACAMLIPYPVLRRLGLFDERFFVYAEDMDYCLRARAAGTGVRVIPQASLKHSINAATRANSGWRQFLYARSRMLLLRKHRQLFQPVALIRREIGETMRICGVSMRYLDFSAMQGYLCGVIAGLKEPF